VKVKRKGEFSMNYKLLLIVPDKASLKACHCMPALVFAYFKNSKRGVAFTNRIKDLAAAAKNSCDVN